MFSFTLAILARFSISKYHIFKFFSTTPGVLLAINYYGSFDASSFKFLGRGASLDVQSRWATSKA